MKRKLKASDLIKSLRKGLTDIELMTVHDLTPRGLEYVLRRLHDQGMITDSEFYSRPTLIESAIFRAFSNERTPVIKCPNCGESLAECSDRCEFCVTREFGKSLESRMEYTMRISSNQSRFRREWIVVRQD